MAVIEFSPFIFLRDPPRRACGFFVDETPFFRFLIFLRGGRGLSPPQPK